MSAQPVAPNAEQRHWIMSFFSRKQGVFWNVAAGAALLGAGYFAARFSSGEEEYEEGPSQQPVPLGRSDNLGGGPFVQEQMASRGRGDVYVEDMPLENNGTGNELNEDYRDYQQSSTHAGDSSYFSSSMKPDRVDELLLKLEQVDEKLNEIKEAVNNRTKRASNNKGDDSSDDNDTNGNAKITDYLEKVDRVPELAEYEANVKQKVQAMQYDKEIEGASASGTLDGSIGALLMYIAKLVEQPTIPRYRRISVTNQTYKALIAPLKGHDEFLKAVGFSKKGTCFEWVDTSSDPPSIDEKEGESGGSSKLRVDKLTSENRLLLLKRSIDLLKARSKEKK